MSTAFLKKTFEKLLGHSPEPMGAAGAGQVKPRPAKENLPLCFDMEPAFEPVYLKCNPYTMTSQERQYNLFKACQHIVQNNIPGDFVECGVWAGGSTMLAAETFQMFGETSRHLYLYDTFSGMTEPTVEDFDRRFQKPVRQKWEKNQAGEVNNWCYIPLEEVQANINKTGYPFEQVHFIKGDILKTVPQTLPQQIALLRLDTDWYASTKHELEHMYPLLVSGGLLIIDDYGTFEGARKAVDEYFAQFESVPFMSRVDNTCRILVKP